VKLLRVYALYKHGAREMERLVHPSSVGGAGRRRGASGARAPIIAWIFFMLFAMSLAAVMLAFALGRTFEPAVVLTIAALSTTGPLAEVAVAAPILYADLSDAAKLSSPRRWCSGGWRRWPSSRCSTRGSGAHLEVISARLPESGLETAGTAPYCPATHGPTCR
jgi:hypothetical protein